MTMRSLLCRTDPYANLDVLHAPSRHYAVGDEREDEVGLVLPDGLQLRREKFPWDSHFSILPIKTISYLLIAYHWLLSHFSPSESPVSGKVRLIRVSIVH